MRDLDRGERVLAWAAVSAGGTVVATQYGLWVPDGQAMRRMGWHLIDRAAWDDGVLEVTEAREIEPGVVEDCPPLRLSLGEPGDVPPVVRARVTRSVAYTVHHPLPGGGVRVVARRIPGRDGLSWAMRYDAGTDRQDPQIRGMAAELLTQAKLVIGVDED